MKTAIDEFDKLVDDLIRRPDEQQTGPDEALEKVEKVQETLRTAQDDDLAARRR